MRRIIRRAAMGRLARFLALPALAFVLVGACSESSSPPVPTQLVIETPAAGAASGSSFTIQPVVAVADAGGRTIATAALQVTMTVSAGASVVGNPVATAINGIAHFSGVGLTGIAGTSYTLTFTAEGLEATSQVVVPTPGVATQLGQGAVASGARSGSAFVTQPVILVQDAAGNTVTTDNSTVVTMSASAGATIVGTPSATVSAGVATFGNVGLSGVAGTQYTLTFSAPDLAPRTQGVTVAPGAATELVLSQAAAGATSGLAFTTQPVVELRDAAGNRATTSTASVRMTVSSGANVIGRSTVAASAGVATFTSAGIAGTANSAYTLTFSSAGLSSANQSITPAAGARVYKDWLRPSYELSRYDMWLSSADLRDGGVPYTSQNPLQVIQTAQVDIDGDGLEDIVTYDSYSMTPPLTNPPPSVFMNNGTVLNKVAWTGPTVHDPHGTKILVGDFNGDALPDLFSLVAVDPPGGGFPTLQDFCNLLLNSSSGFSTVKEFDDQRGFWFTGASGDIDGDGDLDVVMFNFHVGANGVQNKILWNDGEAHFTYDPSGIGSISTVDLAELVDVDHDGFLDLAINYVSAPPGGQRTNHVAVLWGNGAGFSLSNASTFDVDGTKFLLDLGFADLDGDGFEEIVVSGVTDAGVYFVELYKSPARVTPFANRTALYFDANTTTTRFDHIRVQDIDHNGKLDIIAPDRKDNIRWEWNGARFIRQ